MCLVGTSLSTRSRGLTIKNHSNALLSRCSFHALLNPTSDQSSSSKRYIRRAQTDPYGKAKASWKGEKVYIARSAHKLIQLDHQLRLFPRTSSAPLRVLDLGASPGGWTEVAMERLERLRITDSRFHQLVACDLSALAPGLLSKVPSNTQLNFVQGDFLLAETQARILEALGKGRGSMIILSDLLGPISGIPIRDAQASLELCLSVIELAKGVMGIEQEGSLVIKHLQSDLSEEVRKVLRDGWKSVKWVKPLASRSESREGYFVARQRRPESSALER